jgi:hypothetical protein
MNMNDQRLEAYVSLIQQLLDCENGTEGAILQQHEELVDAGLVAVMEQYADLMEAQGDSNAGWLRQFAGQLAQMLGQTGGEQTGVQDAVRFAAEIVQLIAQTQGDRKQIYSFFQSNRTRLNSELLAALPILFKDLVSNNQPEFIAAVFAEFGNLIQQFPLGNRMLNLELGIAAYQLALQVYTREAFPEQWAATQNNLATAYTNLM